MRRPTVALVIALACMLPGPDGASADPTPQSTNLLRLDPGDALELSTGAGFDLSEQGAIEFWYRHDSTDDAFRAFGSRTRLAAAPTVVLSMGRGADFAFAVVVCPGAIGQDAATIAVVRDPTLLGDSDAFMGQLFGDAATPRTEGFLTLAQSVEGQSFPLKLAKGQTYHVILAKPKGSNRIDVFVDGARQGAMQGVGFGETAGRPLVLGFDPASIEYEAVGSSTGPFLFPFEGEIGGIRLWSVGDLEERDAVRLRDFNRSVNLADLTMLPGYAHLLAYGDFTGSRWDRRTRQRRSDASPRLELADPLAGTWYRVGARVGQTSAASSLFDDYPVFDFVRATSRPLPLDDPRCRYRVYEDGNYIGTLERRDDRGPRPNATSWAFAHADGWTSPVTVEIGRRDATILWSLPRPARAGVSIAGASSGTAQLKRRTLAEFRIDSPTPEQMTPAEALQKQRESGGFDLAFLYTAYAKYWDLLFRSYNVVTMDPQRLFETGATPVPVLRVPDDQAFDLDTSEQIILPYSFDVLQSQISMDGETTTLVSTVRERNAEITRRIGFGVSTAFTLGTGAQSPVTAQATVNLNVVLQRETLERLSRETRTTAERLVRFKWDKSHALYHRKEVMQVSEELADALRRLYEECGGVDRGARTERIFAFFDEWGTHYPFAIIYGSLERSETIVDEQMLIALSNRSTRLSVTVNEGETGVIAATGGREEDSTRVGVTTGFTLGAKEPVPIAVDLRPLHTLLSPQQFPDEPWMYRDLRSELGRRLDEYRNAKIALAIDKLAPAARERALEVVSDLASGGDEPRYDAIAVRYRGVSVEDIFDQATVRSSDGSEVVAAGRRYELDARIVFDPRSVYSHPAIEVPDDLRTALERFEHQRRPLVAADRLAKDDLPWAILPGDPPKQIGGDETIMVASVPRDRLRDSLFVAIETAVRGKLVTGGGRKLDLVFGLGVDGGPSTPSWEQLIELLLVRSSFRWPDGQTALWQWDVLSPADKTIFANGERLTGLRLARDVHPTGTTWPPEVLGSSLDPRLSAPRAVRPDAFLLRSSGPSTGGATYSIDKDHDGLGGLARDRVGRATIPRPVLQRFLRSSRDEWQEGTVPLRFAFVEGEGKLPDGRRLTAAFMPVILATPLAAAGTLRIHYEYALLDDLATVVAGNAEVLPRESWGGFRAGAATDTPDPFKNRTTRTVRAAPAAPLPPSILAALGTAAEVPDTTHRIVAADGTALTPRGWGEIEWARQTDDAPWAIAIEPDGRLRIVCTVDGTVLAGAAGAAAHRVALSPPVEGDDRQCWIAEPTEGEGAAYRFRNAASGAYLASTGGEVVARKDAARTSLAAFSVVPPIALDPEPSEPAGPTRADVTRQLAREWGRLSISVDGVSTDDALAEYWAFLVRVADVNGDGKIDDAESRGKGEMSSVEGYRAFLAEEYGPENVDARALEGLKLVRRIEAGRVGTMLLAHLDLNGREGGGQFVDPFEAAPLFKTKEFEHTSFEALDVNGNGELDMTDLFEFLSGGNGLDAP